MATFNEELFVFYAGEKKRLLTVSGQSTGMDVSLETDTLPFPKVCEGSQLTRKLQLENRGDMPARFRWQTPTFGQHFTIAPIEGVVPAGVPGRSRRNWHVHHVHDKTLLRRMHVCN